MSSVRGVFTQEDPDALVVSALGPVYSNNQKRLLTTDDSLYYSKGGVWVRLKAAAGGAAGADTQVQFNDAGTMAGDVGFTYNKTTDKATLAGGLFLTPMTTGSLIFAGASGELLQDNSNLFWDDSANVLMVGRNTTAGTAPRLVIGGGNLVLIPSSGNGSAQFILSANTARNDFLFYDSTPTQKCSFGYEGASGGFHPDMMQIFGAANGILFGDSGLTERLRIDSAGKVGIGLTAAAVLSDAGLLDMNANLFRVRTAKTPASATATGNAGEICWDSGFIYVATAANTWKRVAIATF